MIKTKKSINLQDNLLKPLKIGEIIEGNVISGKHSNIFIDLGAWGTGVIYGKEFREAENTLKKLKAGSSITVKVIDSDNEKGYIELSVKQADKEITWKKLQQKVEDNEILTVKILGANKGGLLTEVEGLPAFLPVSQLSREHYPRVSGADKMKILEELKKLIGQELKVKILDLDKDEEKFILSEKATELEEIKKTLKNYKVGDVVEGIVTGIVDFGVFIKFGKESLEGLVHISELDWQLIENPANVVESGQKIKVKIIDITEDKASLSLKALKKNPWENIGKKYKKGDVVEGKVVKFNPFGAFVQLSARIQGLIHVSEFGSQQAMESIIKTGKKYKFKILTIEPSNYKMTLQMAK